MRILVFLSTLIAFSNSYAQLSNNCGEWKLKDASVNYKMFMRECAYSPIKEVKIIDKFAINCSLKHLAQVVGAVETSKRMTSNCVDARVVQSIDANTAYQYFRYRLVWGVKDRDAITKVTTILTDSTYTFIAEAVDKPDLAPLNADAIRINNSRTYIVFKKNGAGLIEMNYFAFGDPRGSIPTWVINLLARTQVHSGILKMIQLINEK